MTKTQRIVFKLENEHGDSLVEMGGEIIGKREYHRGNHHYIPTDSMLDGVPEHEHNPLVYSGTLAGLRGEIRRWLAGEWRTR